MELTGKGYYIWIIKDCERADPERITAVARASNLSHVIIKVAGGAFPFNIDKDSGFDYARPVIKKLQANNIACWGFHYVLGDYPIQEAEIAIKRTLDLGLDGLVINAEGEYKNPNKAPAATRYMKTLRNNLGNFPLALSSYRFPSFHAGFPFSNFLQYCNYNMPQVYWVKSRNNAGAQLQQTINEYRQIAPFRPIIPTGATFKEHGWVPDGSEVTEFMQAAEKLNLPAVNFWEWGRCRRDLPHLWDLVGNYAYNNQTRANSFLNQYFAALNTKNPDKVVKLYKDNAVHIRSGKAILGRKAIREWIATLMSTYPDGTFTLLDEFIDRNTHNFRWQVQNRNGKSQLKGRDTIGVIDKTIRYHYSFMQPV